MDGESFSAFSHFGKRIFNEEASPVEFHAAYSLFESPTPNRGWYYLTPKGGRLITGFRSNCHSWKSRFFFVGGEWASEVDRALVPNRWTDTTKRGVLSTPPSHYVIYPYFLLFMSFFL